MLFKPQEEGVEVVGQKEVVGAPRPQAVEEVGHR